MVQRYNSDQYSSNGCHAVQHALHCMDHNEELLQLQGMHAPQPTLAGW
jgi:hypothetical protein